MSSLRVRVPHQMVHLPHAACRAVARAVEIHLTLPEPSSTISLVTLAAHTGLSRSTVWRHLPCLRTVYARTRPPGEASYAWSRRSHVVAQHYRLYPLEGCSRLYDRADRAGWLAVLRRRAWADSAGICGRYGAMRRWGTRPGFESRRPGMGSSHSPHPQSPVGDWSEGSSETSVTEHEKNAPWRPDPPEIMLRHAAATLSHLHSPIRSRPGLTRHRAWCYTGSCLPHCPGPVHGLTRLRVDRVDLYPPDELRSIPMPDPTDHPQHPDHPSNQPRRHRRHPHPPPTPGGVNLPQTIPPPPPPEVTADQARQAAADGPAWLRDFATRVLPQEESPPPPPRQRRSTRDDLPWW